MIPNYSFMPVDLTTVLRNSSHTAVSRSCCCVSKMNFRKMDSISSTISKIHSQRRHFIINWCLHLLLPAPHRQWVMRLTNQEACGEGYWTGRAIMLGVKQVLRRAVLLAPTRGSECLLLGCLINREILCPSDMGNYLNKCTRVWQFLRNDNSDSYPVVQGSNTLFTTHNLSPPHNCVFK